MVRGAISKQGTVMVGVDMVHLPVSSHLKPSV